MSGEEINKLKERAKELLGREVDTMQTPTGRWICNYFNWNVQMTMQGESEQELLEKLVEHLEGKDEAIL